MGSIRTGEKAVTRYRLGETTPSAVYRGTERLWPGQDTELLIEATGSLYITLDAPAAVDFGDGCVVRTSLGFSGNNASHTYAADGVYRIRIAYDDGQAHQLGVGWWPVTPYPLRGVRIGGDASEIGGSAFWDAGGAGHQLLVMTVPGHVAGVGYMAFAQTNVVLAEIAAQRLGTEIFYECPDLRKVWLRESVAEMDTETVYDVQRGPFYGATAGAMIYCEADTQPAGWPAGWNEIDGEGTALTVVWGQKTRPW